MMTRWSTDACRRDPSIVSSNLTNPTFSHTIVFCERSVPARPCLHITKLMQISLNGAMAPAAPDGAPPRRARD